MTACAAQPKQAPHPGACRAGIAAVGAAKMCPSAPIQFQMAVAECADSAGTFTYEYTLVNQARKATVRKSGAWTSNRKQWRHEEQVPLQCDDEIFDVQVVQITACACRGR